MKINKLVFQSITFLCFVFVPTLASKLFDFEVSYLNPEIIFTFIVGALWLFSIENLYRDKTSNTSLRIFYTILISSLFIALGAHAVANLFNDHLFVGEVLNQDIKDTAYFFDETFSHYVYASIYVLLIGWLTFYEKVRGKLTFIVAIVNGFGLMVLTIEGQVVLPVLVLSIAWLAFIFTKSKLSLTYPQVLFTTSTILILLWGISNQGFVEFSELGWI